MIIDPIEREKVVKELIAIGEEGDADTFETTDVKYKYIIGMVDEDTIGITQIKIIQDGEHEEYEEVATFHMVKSAFTMFADAIESFSRILKREEKSGSK